MKVNLGIKTNFLNGYMNLDCVQDPNSKCVFVDPFKLETVLDHNEIDEVFLVNDTLDFLHLQARPNAISHWLTKLAHGGKIVIMGNDLQEVCRLGHLGQLDPNQLNSIVYGFGKKSAVRPIDNIQMILQTGQFDLEDNRYNVNIPFQYITTLRRK